ncbi:hypothetical protein CAPTEDRAFT_192226 [Capitella teleta]|uniref:Uncharacterized protein n=1 Tax=Capitella teleta TaxID=283909 RepID=R7TQH8_CAPTE|nr:hypothetical protein CAPTEDRAFT_192226 [Capitella teleta]|eukprot:ELT95792.1 hypothetical protein CAPTEDRAFT_192226 [Capitella teleta]
MKSVGGDVWVDGVAFCFVSKKEGWADGGVRKVIDEEGEECRVKAVFHWSMAMRSWEVKERKPCWALWMRLFDSRYSVRAYHKKLSSPVEVDPDMELVPPETGREAECLCDRVNPPQKDEL